VHLSTSIITWYWWASRSHHCASVNKHYNLVLVGKSLTPLCICQQAL